MKLRATGDTKHSFHTVYPWSHTRGTKSTRRTTRATRSTSKITKKSVFAPPIAAECNRDHRPDRISGGFGSRRNGDHALRARSPHVLPRQKKKVGPHPEGEGNHPCADVGFRPDGDSRVVGGRGSRNTAVSDGGRRIEQRQPRCSDNTDDSPFLAPWWILGYGFPFQLLSQSHSAPLSFGRQGVLNVSVVRDPNAHPAPEKSTYTVVNSTAAWHFERRWNRFEGPRSVMDQFLRSKLLSIFQGINIPR